MRNPLINSRPCFEAELAETTVAEERDARQRSHEHASVPEVKDDPRHGLERGQTDEVEGYDDDSTIDHENKDEEANRRDDRQELQSRQ